MKTRYKNPFQIEGKRYAPAFYETDKPSTYTHRGVSVYRNAAGWFDYVFEGMCITQREGKSSEAIDELLDGKFPRNDEITAHLRAHGFKTISYAEMPA